MKITTVESVENASMYCKVLGTRLEGQRYTVLVLCCKNIFLFQLTCKGNSHFRHFMIELEKKILLDDSVGRSCCTDNKISFNG
jgi:hypothetical protein